MSMASNSSRLTPTPISCALCLNCWKSVNVSIIATQPRLHPSYPGKLISASSFLNDLLAARARQGGGNVKLFNIRHTDLFCCFYVVQRRIDASNPLQRFSRSASSSRLACAPSLGCKRSFRHYRVGRLLRQLLLPQHSQKPFLELLQRLVEFSRKRFGPQRKRGACVG